jgi:hypothetical protein
MEGEEVNELELNTDELVNVALGTNFPPFVILMRRQHLDNKTVFLGVYRKRVIEGEQ